MSRRGSPITRSPARRDRPHTLLSSAYRQKACPRFSSIREGASVRAIVRPHDIRILPATAAAAPAGTTTALARRVVSLGGHVKLDLGLPTVTW